MPHTPSHRTDSDLTAVRARLFNALDRFSDDTVEAAQVSTQVVPERDRPERPEDTIANAIAGAAQRLSDQPIFEATQTDPEPPDILTAGPGDIRQFLTEDQQIELTLGDVGSGIMDFVGQLATDVKDMFNFGSEVIRQSGNVAKMFRADDPTEQIAGLEDFINSIPEDQEESITRGAALTGAFMLAAPAGLFAREGFTRLAGAALKTGLRGQAGFLGQSVAESQMAQAALRLGIKTGAGAAEGATFGTVYGSMRPLHDGEHSRSDAILGDAMAFGMLDAGFRVLGTGLGALSRRVAPDVDEASAIRDIFDNTRRMLVEERQQGVPFAHPMPPEAFSPEEVVAQYSAGASTQAPMRSGPLARFREAGRAFVSSITERFPNAGKIDPQIQTGALQFLDSEVTGKYFGRRAFQLLTRNMGEEEVETFGRALVESRLRQVKRDRLNLASKLDRAESAMASGQRAGIEGLQSRFTKQGVKFNDEGRAVVELNGNQFTSDDLREMTARMRDEILSPEERQLLELPRFQQAFDDLENVVNPLLTEVAQRNGLRTLVNPELPFVRLRPASRRDIEAGVPVIRGRADIDDDIAREMVERGRVFSAGGRTAGAQETGGARAAFGQAPLYVSQPEEILSRSFQEVFSKDYQNEVVARIANAPWSLKTKTVETSAGNRRTVLDDGSAPPTEIEFAGETYPARTIRLTGNPQVLSRRSALHSMEEAQRRRLNFEVETSRPFPESPLEEVTLRARSPDGEDLLEVRGQLSREERIFDINEMEAAAGGAGQFNVSELRDVARAIRREFPEVETLSGVRGEAGTQLSTGTTVTGQRSGERQIPLDRLLPDEAKPLQAQDLTAVESEGLTATGGSEVIEPELGTYVVPKPIADLWEETFERFGRRQSPLQTLFPESAAREVLEGFMDFNVRLLLSSPVEAFAHSNRVLSQLSSIPGVGDRDALGRIANRFGAWFGPRLTGLREMFDLYRNPEALRMEAFLAAKVPGAIPTRAFPFEFASESVGDFARTQGGDEGILRTAEEALELGRRFLFDLPEINNRSVFQFGFDTRARVVGSMALRKITKREIGREPTIREYQQFLEQFGQYTDDIQSNLVQGLRKSRMAPFAGTQAGFIPAEIRKLFGNPNLPKSIRNELSLASQARLRAETLWRGVVGTSTMLALTQKALTDDWPWENEQGHQTDLKVGFISDKGERRPVYVPLSRILDPVSGRGMRIVGGRAVMENLGDSEDIIPDALRDVANTAITFTTGSPGLGMASTIATGSAPFITDEGEILRLVPPQPNTSLTMKHRFFEAFGTANPTIESLFGLGHTGDLPTGIRLLGTVSPGLDVGAPVDIGASGAIREERAELFEISRDRVSQALRKFPRNFGERRQFYREEADKFGSRRERERAFRSMLRMDVQVRRSRQLNLQRARRDQPFP